MARIVAVAATDPLDRRTFSGLSANLFEELRRQGVAVDSIATKDIRWLDALRGAVVWRELLTPASRSRSRISPDWFWSRATSELMTRRFSRRLAALPTASHVLQIGTHVQAAGAGRRAFCLTDMTVVQAIESGGMYQSARASRTIREEAIAWQREVFASCERIFVLSDWAGRSVIEDYGQPAAKVVTVGAGANLPEVLPPRDLDPDAPAILFVGLDWVQKGGPLLLEAFRKVRGRVPGARLVVIGCRPPGLEREPGVEVIGRLDRSRAADEDRMLRAYATATCFCIVPSVDAFPNVLLEAAAFGVPVVSTDEGSRSEAVVHGGTGLLVPPSEPDALAAALVEVLSNPALATRLGLAGAKHVLERYTWPTVARTILSYMGLAPAVTGEDAGG